MVYCVGRPEPLLTCCHGLYYLGDPMSKVLYITSLNAGDGKTALSAALARRWQQAGKRVEYLKPVSLAGASERSFSPAPSFPFVLTAPGFRRLTP